MSLTHLDLFSGIGGFTIAAEAAGFQTIGFSEIEPYACKILKRHWPTVPNFGDIRNVRGINADLITGGFPCQPFSCAGQRRGAKDDRHLWPEMCRVVEDAQPTWVLGENVPGIIGMELDRVLSDLENIGYACWPIVIPACAVDARHRRDRVWIVAHASSIGSWTGKEPNGQRVETSNSCKAVANSNQQGLQGRDSRILSEREYERTTGAGDSSISDTSLELPHGTGQTRNWRSQPPNHFEWLPEPELGRVAHGIPNRSHRLKALGNAIVPQVAEVLMREMAKAIAK